MKKALPALILATLTAASGAGADTLKAAGRRGDLFLVSAPQSPSFLLAADGSRVELPLAAGARVRSFVAAGDSWFAAAVDGERLVVLAGRGDRIEEIRGPEVVEPAQLGGPTLLVDGETLRGLAWVEGPAPRRQVVRAAAFLAGGFRAAVEVGPRGPGSQLALTAAATGDGSWILAWAAFDGEDDEILWSRLRPSGEATPPRRLADDNAVPDITPHLWATKDGVLAAWSRYDGNDYRVQLARFDGETWSKPAEVGGPGSLYPVFQDGPRGPLLLYLEASPRAWAVTELDRRGRLKRRVAVPSDRDETPIVTAVTSAGAQLLWIDGSGGRQNASAAGWQRLR